MSELTDQHRGVIESVVRALQGDGVEVTLEGGAGEEGSVYGLVATAEDGTEAHLTMALSLRHVPEPDWVVPGPPPPLSTP